ncbi:PaaI family thioesterase [Phreatobacter aquaticus]|uniref:PaaI family thioesterase n=1 Tax=Phreatobacter aquaticus TaxID=2570229 RepID=A0A4D7QD01_9HYPH|nr:PaaI family thioesterase [Phreatobacter aquaticus]QCK85880.1 PaaI family thioesterase [Phreatobacter aquaticus]
MTIRYGVVETSEATGQDGIDFLRGMIDRRYPSPPIAQTMGFTLVEVAPGRAVFEGTPTAAFFNPLGTVHGGWTATILDSALGCCIHTMIKAGQGYTTVEMKVNYVRALMPETGLVRCEAVVIHSGRTIATSEAKLIDTKGRLIAHGTETCMIFDARPPRA